MSITFDHNGWYFSNNFLDSECSKKLLAFLQVVFETVYYKTSREEQRSICFSNKQSSTKTMYILLDLHLTQAVLPNRDERCNTIFSVI